MTIKYLVDFTRELPSKLTSIVFSLLKWTHTYFLIHPAKYCGGKVMKIPSLDKEFLLQHREHEFALSIQWFFIESARLDLPSATKRNYPRVWSKEWLLPVLSILSLSLVLIAALFRHLEGPKEIHTCTTLLATFVDTAFFFACKGTMSEMKSCISNILKAVFKRE